MAIDASLIMSLVPAIGGVITFVVFLMIIQAHIRKIDQEMEAATSGNWWDDDENVAEIRIGDSVNET